VLEEAQDDDDGDFEPGKGSSKKAKKGTAKKEERVVGKRPRLVASWTVGDALDIDGDAKSLESTKKRAKAVTKAGAKLAVRAVDKDKALDEHKQRNLKAVGKWDVVDCSDCYWLELWLKGNGLAGKALVCDCDVDLTCNDLYGPDMRFKAIFKTEKTKYVGVMIIRLNQNGTLSIEYSNGARGVARVDFMATVQRRKAKK
jgi:hypothetical protein